jgi:peroxiredoxin
MGRGRGGGLLRKRLKFGGDCTAIVGVSVDTVDSHQQFCTKERLSFNPYDIEV